MSLTIKLKNIGILKQAEFSLGDLTLICGENNTSKTYAAYALYGFLRSWREHTDFPISDTEILRLFTEGIPIPVKLPQKTGQLLTAICQNYTNSLDTVFAAPEGTFQNSEFCLLTNDINVHDTRELHSRVEIPQLGYFIISKHKQSNEIIITVGEKTQDIAIVAKLTKNIKQAIHQIIPAIVFWGIFPNPFISTAERTGIATFRKELDSAWNRRFAEISLDQSDPNTDSHELLFKPLQNYPSSIEANMEFTRRLEEFAKSKSFIAKEHPEILEDFSDIVGGEYTVTQNDQLYYVPKDTQLRLTMVESSSTVRSLLDLSFYLNCIAQKGDLLMIDEPELSLHPENQRRIARLFARLANIGVKVFITTHSDYIIKELNTLMMLNHDKPHLKRVAEENGYQDNELIKADQVKVYIAEKALLPLEKGQKRRRRGHTLVPADIDPEFGIEVGSFDKTIDTMNKIQRDIVWGAK